MSILIGIPVTLGFTDHIEACAMTSVFFFPFAIIVPFVEDDTHSNRVVIEKKSV